MENPWPLKEIVTMSDGIMIEETAYMMALKSSVVADRQLGNSITWRFG